MVLNFNSENFQFFHCYKQDTVRKAVVSSSFYTQTKGRSGSLSVYLLMFPRLWLVELEFKPRPVDAESSLILTRPYGFTGVFKVVLI